MAQPIDSDLTKGPMSGHFRALAVPAALSMLFSTLYNVVDMFFAGLLSTSAQAGLALGFQAFMILMAVGMGLGAAMGSLVGNALGAEDRPGARALIAQGLSFGVLASVVLAVAGLWLGPLLVSLVSESGAYRDAANRYFSVMLLALPGFLIAFGCNGILQAHGDGRSMQRALMVAFVANIGLNPLFIFGIPGIVSGIGFPGLALSTVVSQTGVMAYMLWQVRRLRTMSNAMGSEFRPRPAAFAEIAQQVAPIYVSMLVLSVAGFVLQFALKGFGEHAVAGYGVGIRLEQLLLLPALGVTSALLPIAAQNYGAGHHERVREALWYCWKIGLIMTGIACPVIWLFGRYVLQLFTDDPDVVRVALAYLRVDSLLLPLYMMMFAVNSFLQALKRPIWTVWISLYRQGFGVAFFVWLFVGVWGFPEIGVWFGLACAVTTGWLLSMIIAQGRSRQALDGLSLWPGGARPVG